MATSSRSATPATAGLQAGLLGERFGRLEEYHVGRGVVEHRRQAAGGPKVLPRLGQAQVRPLDGQDLQRRLHADEDAEKQHGHLQDRGIVEAVRAPQVAAAQRQRQRHQRQLHDFPQIEPRMPIGAGQSACRDRATPPKQSRRPAARRWATGRQTAADARGFRRGRRRRAVRADSTRNGPRA